MEAKLISKGFIFLFLLSTFDPFDSCRRLRIIITAETIIIMYHLPLSRTFILLGLLLFSSFSFCLLYSLLLYPLFSFYRLLCRLCILLLLCLLPLFPRIFISDSRPRDGLSNGVCLTASLLDDPLEVVLFDEEVDLFDELFQVAPDEILGVAFQGH